MTDIFDIKKDLPGKKNVNKGRAFLFLIPVPVLIGYGLLIRSIGSGTSFYLIWIGLALLFVLLALWHIFRAGRELPVLLRRIGSILMLILLAVFLVIEGFILSDFGRQCEDVDYLIVLGAQIKEEGPSQVLRYRLDTAAEYLKEHPDTICIVSGAKGDNEPVSEAEGMASYLVSCGIDESRILKEEKARNTSENISFSREMMDSPEASAAIVTNNFHMHRALGIARKQGMNDIEGLSAPSARICLPNNMLREFFGCLKDLLTGRMRL